MTSKTVNIQIPRWPNYFSLKLYLRTQTIENLIAIHSLGISIIIYTLKDYIAVVFLK